MICYICLIGLLLVTLSSCIGIHNGTPYFVKKDSKIRNQVVDVIMYSCRNDEGDKDKVYEILRNANIENQFSAEYEKWHEMFKEIGNFSLTLESYDSSTENGVTVQECTFGLYSEKGNFIVKASMRSDTEGLTSFYAEPDTEGVLPEKD